MKARRGQNDGEALPDHQELQGGLLEGLQGRVCFRRPRLLQQLPDESQKLRVFTLLFHYSYSFLLFISSFTISIDLQILNLLSSFIHLN